MRLVVRTTAVTLTTSEGKDHGGEADKALDMLFVGASTACANIPMSSISNEGSRKMEEASHVLWKDGFEFVDEMYAFVGRCSGRIS